MPSQIVGRIGEIKGFIRWFSGEVPITLGKFGIPGRIIGIDDAIDITPIHVKIIPPTEEGSFGSTFETPITGRSKVTFGKVSVSRGKVSAPYAVSKLPLGVSIQLRVRAKHVPGSFPRDANPQDAILERGRPVVENFNFHFLPPPK
jgi:hypothetical protein